MIKHFISLEDLTSQQIRSLIDRTISEKDAYITGTGPRTLENKTLAMIFEKPSLRTRISFEVSMSQLGGSSIYLAPADIGLGKREPVKDVARVLGRMCDGIMARTFKHELVTELAAWSPSPVINGLTDYNHPCQAMSDMVTIREHFGDLEGRTLAFVGDGNNVARSLAVCCVRLGIKFLLACPRGYAIEEGFIEKLLKDDPGAAAVISHDPADAISQADVIYTDTWVSMGQEDEKIDRQEAFAKFQINADLVSHAPDHVIVMHCLPAYRGFEITDKVFENHVETIMNQAENRLHFQRTILSMLMGEGDIAQD